MRTAIEVKDLNLRQWDHIRQNVPVGKREFPPDLPTACVVFEVSSDLPELHIEMDLAEFVVLMIRLQGIRNETAVADLAEAYLGETTGSGKDGD